MKNLAQRLQSLRSSSSASSLLRVKEIGIIAALALTIVFFAVFAGGDFLSGSNWQDIGENCEIIVVVGVGELFVVLTRNIDISVESIVGLTAYVSANWLMHHHSVPLGIVVLVAMLIGVVMGMINGILVVVMKVPAIIATLATLSVYRGIDAIYNGGNQTVASSLPDRFLNLNIEAPLGIPILVWLALIVALAGAAVLRWVPWARDLFAVGSNPDAARYAGIRVDRRIFAAFMVSGAMAGLGGFMYAVNYPNLDGTAATNFFFTVITALVIGGVNIFGGSGSTLAVVLGAVLVAVINNGFVLLKINDYWAFFFDGAAIVVAVALNAFTLRRVDAALRRSRGARRGDAAAALEPVAVGNEVVVDPTERV